MTDSFFEEGVEAYREGYELNECPYGEGTDGEAGWIRGWQQQAQLEVSCGN